MSALVAALRISRRSAWRARGRSALIVLMIGLPVLLITGLLVLYATGTVNLNEGIGSRIGAADAGLVQLPPGATIEQSLNDISWTTDGGDERPPAQAAEIIAVLGPGTRVIPFGTGTIRLPSGPVTALEVDLNEPLTKGLLTLDEGRLPKAGEVVVTPALGLRPGDLLRPADAPPLKVTGIVDHPHQPTIRQVAGPDLPLAQPARVDLSLDAGPGWLAAAPRPVTWNDVAALNKLGLSVVARDLLPDQTGRPAGLWDTPLPIGIAAIVIMVVLVPVLLAGPAFAVGLRRRRRELADIAAQGGSAAHLRLIVLADGLVLGGFATLTATGLGIGAGLGLAPVIARLGGQIGPPEIPWREVLYVAAIGLFTGLVAALVPALQAGRQHTTTVLAGRAPATPRRPWPLAWSLIGVALVLGGVAASVAARRQQELVWPFVSSLPVLFGLVALTPFLVWFCGRIASRLRLPLRIAVRDAVRNRSRTVSAVAAVIAVTAAAVEVGIAVESQRQDYQDSFTSARPVGMLAIWGGTMRDSTWTKLRAEAGRLLPGVPLALGYHLHDAEGRRHAMRYTTRWNGARVPRTAAVGDRDLLRLLQGRDDPAAAAALASGKAVVFDASNVRDGKITLRASVANHPDRRIEVPAVVATPADEFQGGTLLPLSFAEREGFTATPRQLYAIHDLPRDSTLWSDLTKVIPRVSIATETGPQNPSGAVWLWIWLGAAVLLVVGGTLAATRLAAADMRPDRATMLAIGAPPWTLRWAVAGQALFIAGLGAVVGLAAGTVTGVALSRPMTSQGTGDPATIAFPWMFLAALVVGLPLLASAMALITRARAPLTRRLS
ncbi:FtsX-like permease family protein [Herbidospora galbida]|uniref:FtsX-like permease family protein n=1 Tax=Herbidospora galbida TaxID=2575442 RepID=A0A4U3MEF2_9ACTN|nr:ABC transporter permease [Herbidospora galbida]TKK87605.1 FtsX-like permease family protein [Herbidospora galbida]